MVKSIRSRQLSGYTPFSRSIIWGWVAFGILTIWSYFAKLSGGNPHATLPFVPPVLEIISSLFIITGSLLMLLSGRVSPLTKEWKLDRSGLVLAFGGWLSQFIGIFSADFTQVGGMLFCAIAMTAIAARLITSYTYEEYVKYKVSLWNNGSTPKQ